MCVFCKVGLGRTKTQNLFVLKGRVGRITAIRFCEGPWPKNASKWDPGLKMKVEFERGLAAKTKVDFVRGPGSAGRMNKDRFSRGPLVEIRVDVVGASLAKKKGRLVSHTPT